MTDAPHLLPCPFCGGDMRHIVLPEDAGDWHEHPDNGCIVAIFGGIIETPDYAAWNRRAAPEVQALIREAVERSDRALKPFADKVFNDNGDVTVSDTHRLSDVDFWNAYSARNVARAALHGEPK